MNNTKEIKKASINRVLIYAQMRVMLKTNTKIKRDTYAIFLLVN